MTKNLFVVPALALGLALAVPAQTPPTKVGIIHIQNAMLSTKDGQKALNELQTRFKPKKDQLDKLQGDIGLAQEQFNKGSATMSEDARQKLARDIDQKKKQAQRETEDAQAEVEQAEGKIMQELGQKMMAIIDKYAKEHAYALVLDVSSQQTPVLYAANGIDITPDIIALYDRTNGGGGGAAAAPTPAPAARPTAAPKPPTAPAVKK